MHMKELMNYEELTINKFYCVPWLPPNILNNISTVTHIFSGKEKKLLILILSYGYTTNLEPKT